MFQLLRLSDTQIVQTLKYPYFQEVMNFEASSFYFVYFLSTAETKPEVGDKTDD